MAVVVSLLSCFLDELPLHIDYPAKGTQKKDPKQVANHYLANIQAMLAQKRKEN